MDGRTPSPWTPYATRRAGARLRLFCFAHAGGSALVYQAWGERLPDDVEVFPVELPGRGRRLRERPLDTIGAMASAAAEALAPLLDRPFALFGCSMGALVGFELARELRRRGAEQPRALLVASCGAPHRFEVRAGARLSELDDDAVIAELRRYDGTPRVVLENREMMRLVLPALRADFGAAQAYRFEPGAPLRVPVFGFLGEHDAMVSRTGFEAWCELTSGGFEGEFFPGGHFFLQSPGSGFAESLALRLARIAASGGALRSAA